jgi:hypothetical protein
MIDQTNQGETKVKKILLTVLLLSTPAFACTGFFKTEYVSGMNKICIYDHLGSDVAITVKSYQLCPLSIHVPH